MKNRLRCFLLAALSSAASMIVHAQPPREVAPPQSRPPPPPVERLVTFLGVDASPMRPDLAAQLGLPEGMGLIVNHVMPDSPAAAVFKDFDVITKFEDQLLNSPGQLGMLVRMAKEGDEVTLTFFRAGKEQKARVKLARRNLPPPPKFDRLIPGPGGRKGPSDPWSPALTIGKGGKRIALFNTNQGEMVFEDEDGRLVVTSKDGKRTLLASGPKGEPIFSGPIDTPEQRKALPSGLEKRLEKIENVEELPMPARTFGPGADVWERRVPAPPVHIEYFSGEEAPGGQPFIMPLSPGAGGMI